MNGALFSRPRMSGVACAVLLSGGLMAGSAIPAAATTVSDDEGELHDQQLAPSPEETGQGSEDAPSSDPSLPPEDTESTPPDQRESQDPAPSPEEPENTLPEETESPGPSPEEPENTPPEETESPGPSPEEPENTPPEETDPPDPAPSPESPGPTPPEDPDGDDGDPDPENEDDEAQAFDISCPSATGTVGSTVTITCHPSGGAEIASLSASTGNRGATISVEGSSISYLLSAYEGSSGTVQDSFTVTAASPGGSVATTTATVTLDAPSEQPSDTGSPTPSPTTSETTSPASPTSPSTTPGSPTSPSQGPNSTPGSLPPSLPGAPGDTLRPTPENQESTAESEPATDHPLRQVLPGYGLPEAPGLTGEAFGADHSPDADEETEAAEVLAETGLRTASTFGALLLTLAAVAAGVLSLARVRLGR